MKKIESQPWWPKLVAKKDDKSLRQLSEEFGVSPAAISNAFKRNRLTRKAAPSGPRKKATKAPKKATKTPKKAARVATKRSAAKPVAKTKRAKTVRASKATKPSKAPTVRRTVRKRKTTPATKITSRTAGTAKSGARRVRQSTLSQYRNEMGKVVDRIIAEKAGVTVSAVTNYRRRHNIPAVAGRGRPRSRVPTAKAPVAKTPVAAKSPARKVRKAATPSRHYAFRVRIDGEKLIVVAKDIAEAAQIAVQSGKGTVSQIRLIGPALL